MMNIVKRDARIVSKTSYELVFDDGCYGARGGSSYAFSCDENGNVTTTDKGVLFNFHNCLEHPEKFRRFNKVIKHTDTWVEDNTVGVCECGLSHQLHRGDFQCSCKRWYNGSGQELNDPSEWDY